MNAQHHDALESNNESNCPPGAVGRNCEEVALSVPGPDPVGRRIYIHENTLVDLATQGRDAAVLVYQMVAHMMVLKAIHHDIQEDGVLFGLISPERAQAIAEAANKTWFESASAALHRVRYRPSERDLREDFYPVLDKVEGIVAACYFSNYYTFATGEETARLMFLDTNDIATMRQKMKEGIDYKDLTFIKGRCLTMIDPGIGVDSAKADLYLRPNSTKDALSASSLNEIKTQIHRQTRKAFDRIISASIGLPISLEEEDLLNKVRDSIEASFSRGILKTD